MADEEDFQFVRSYSASGTERPDAGRKDSHLKRAYRLSITGSTRVGKTAIISRFLWGTFNEAEQPTIEQYYHKFYRVNNNVYRLDVVDCSGQRPFPARRRLSIETGDVFIVVFAWDDAASFHRAVDDYTDIRSQRESAPLVLVGNKSDIDADRRRVTQREVDNFIARQQQQEQTDTVEFIDCSAKQDENIDLIFQKLFELASFPRRMTRSPTLTRRRAMTEGSSSLLSRSVRAVTPSSMRRHFSSACVVQEIVEIDRRPSIRTELRESITVKHRPAANPQNGRKRFKCCIQ